MSSVPREETELEFPVVDTGWFMTRIEGCTLLYMDGRMNPRSFEHYLSVLGRELDTRTNAAPVLYDVPRVWSLSPVHRLRVAHTLIQRSDRANEVTSTFVLVTQSSAVKGVLTAISWLISPSYPICVKKDLEGGFNALSETIQLTPAALQRAYETAKLNVAAGLN